MLWKVYSGVKVTCDQRLCGCVRLKPPWWRAARAHLSWCNAASRRPSCSVPSCGLIRIVYLLSQDREFLEMDMTFNGAPNKPSETPPPSPDPSLTSADRRRGMGCCARRFSKHRRFLVNKVILQVGNHSRCWLLFQYLTHVTVHSLARHAVSSFLCCPVLLHPSTAIARDPPALPPATTGSCVTPSVTLHVSSVTLHDMSCLSMISHCTAWWHVICRCVSVTHSQLPLTCLFASVSVSQYFRKWFLVQI